MKMRVNGYWLAVLVAGMATSVLAQPPGRGERERVGREDRERPARMEQERGGRPGGMDRRGPSVDRLNLEPAERKAVEALVATHRQEMEDLMVQNREAREQMRELMQDESASEEALVRASRKANDAMGAIQEQRMRHFVALREAIGHEKALRMTLMWRERVRDGMRERARSE